MSKLYDAAKKVTLKQIRDLKVGDILECYYKDSEQPVIEIVVSTTTTAREGYLNDVRLMRLDLFGQRSASLDGSGWLGTEKFRRIAHGADIAARLQVTAQQSSSVADLTELALK